jgi:hypothetical protein
MSTTWRTGIVWLLAALVVACVDDETSTASSEGATTGGGASTGVPTLDVTGSVVDFETENAIDASATLVVAGVEPPPTVQITGADFVVEDVPPFSVFHLLAGAPPSYHNTYTRAIEVKDADLSGVTAEVVGESYLAALETAFGVSPPPGTGILFARALDDTGTPLAGVSGAVFALDGVAPASGPFFLDEERQTAPMATETSASGWVVFYGVPAGLVTVGAADGSGLTIVAPAAPTAAGTVTIVDVVVGGEAVVVPTNVSFADDVVPIFAKRGCDQCHSGNSIGADLGDLALSGGNNKIHSELTDEVSPTYMKTRVDLVTPEASLVLTMPGAENPADAHPNITFASELDPDRLTILGWVIEGAQNN